MKVLCNLRYRRDWTNASFVINRIEKSPPIVYTEMAEHFVAGKSSKCKRSNAYGGFLLVVTLWEL